MGYSALIQVEQLGQSGDRDLFPHPFNSFNSLPYGVRNRGADALREQLQHQALHHPVVGHGCDDAPLGVAASGLAMEQRVSADEGQQQLEVPSQAHRDGRDEVRQLAGERHLYAALALGEPHLQEMPRNIVDKICPVGRQRLHDGLGLLLGADHAERQQPGLVLGV
jgi:hypothetical protein